METKELMFYFFFLFFYGFTVKYTNWFQNLITIIHNYNSMNVLFNFYEEEEEEENDTLVISNNNVIKYEDKYWEEIHKIDCDYFFTHEELLLEEKQYNDEKDKFEKEKIDCENKLNILKTNILTLLDNDLEEANKIQEELKDEIQKMEKFISENDEDQFLERARNHVIKIHTEKLKKCFVIEKTPLGNVAMYYNADRESFEYFSDNTIPYRFLEVVGRKYVITFQCIPLYIIMEEELKKFEKKLEEKQKQQQQQKEEEEQNKNTTTTIVAKKNVFAKFKSYNSEAGSGRVNKAPPPKNSIPRSKQENTNAKIILKENANHYTYEGRFSNFNPLQKIERKQVDKKYGTSYAEFKKMLKK
jgi:hypothetical protein